MTEEERFWAKVDTGGECWIWTGYVMPNGYGTFNQHDLAHRWVYEHEVGPIPEGHDINHLCFTRNCVRPAHLEAITRKENINYSLAHLVAARRQRMAASCKNGHAWTPENTIQTAIQRVCRSCRKAIARRHYLKNRRMR